MPYTTEKSPIFQVVESFFNEDRKRALKCLWSLLDGKSIGEEPPVYSTTLNTGPLNTPQLRQAHVNEHWWGFKANPAGGWDPQPPFNSNSKPTTGFWESWYGNAEKVFRETLIRALSVSLGIPRESANDTAQYKGQDRPATMHGDRHWPISFIWKCPSPWYEGWIEFKKWGTAPREGHVTICLSTPAHGVELFTSPIRDDDQQADPYHAYQFNPREPAGPNGMWLVSQVEHLKWEYTPSNQGSSPGSMQVPLPAGTYVRSVGPVVCVSPSVPNGGTAPDGIAYVAPTP
jgi:hypothetical protein